MESFNGASFFVDSDDVEYSEDHITSTYKYRDTAVKETQDGRYVVKPTTRTYQFRTERKVPRVGVMLVGWGGNNGSTVTASIIANRNNISWDTMKGEQSATYFGSLFQASTVRLGFCRGEEVYVPMRDILPMVHPNDLVVGGWDISSAPLDQAMKRAQVLPVELQRQLAPEMAKMTPLPAIHRPHFIAANQDERADNTLKGSLQEQMDQVRADIRTFKQSNNLDKVIVLWTANTERFSEVIAGVHDTADAFLQAVRDGHAEVSASSVYAAAAILEHCAFINGAPQNTLVPGILELAQREGVMVGGDDFKSGQTKMKSVLADFLVQAGIKPTSIVSYNHLGNNDGKNLNAPQCFRSKEISKRNVVDDLVASNKTLYPGDKDHPDHVVVIKYVPAVGDSKRAMDEYTSEIFMGGVSTIVMHNTCEDSLLASPLILDLVMLTELLGRIQWRTDPSTPFQPFDPVASLLSYMLKAPVVSEGTPIVNALNRQRSAIENVLKACVGLPPEDHMMLECRTDVAAFRKRAAVEASSAAAMRSTGA